MARWLSKDVGGVAGGLGKDVGRRLGHRVGSVSGVSVGLSPAGFLSYIKVNISRILAYQESPLRDLSPSAVSEERIWICRYDCQEYRIDGEGLGGRTGHHAMPVIAAGRHLRDSRCRNIREGLGHGGNVVQDGAWVQGDCLAHDHGWATPA